MSAPWWCALLAANVALAACGDDEHTSPDAGPAGEDASLDAEVPFEPAAPAPPVLPVMTPCPEGWREVPDDETARGLVRCDPWPEGGRVDCPDGEAHFPGTPGCAPLGTPCSPDDEWATDLPAGADVIYVQAGREGGNGLRGNPFGSLQLAIDVAAARGDTIVALSKGTYDGAFYALEPVTIWGACPAETVLTRTNVATSGMVLEIGGEGGVSVRNLGIDSEQIGIGVFDEGMPVTLDALAIRGRYVGLIVTLGGQASATNVVVRDVTSDDLLSGGQGLAVLDGGQADVSRALFLRNRTSGVIASDEGSRLTLHDVGIADTLPEEVSGYGGSGVQIRGLAGGGLERVVIEGNHSGGVFIDETTGVVEISDVVVRRTIPIEEAGGGMGVLVADEAQVVMRRVDVADNAQTGVRIDYAASAEIEDLVVTGTRVVPGFAANLGNGLGLSLGEDCSVTARRGLFSQNADIAVVAIAPGASLDAEDVTVLDMQSNAGRAGALFVAQGAEGRVARLYAARCGGGAASCSGSLDLTDALIEDTESIGVTISDGWGLGAAGADARLTIERVIVRRQHSIGLFGSLGGQVVGRDVQILDTSSVAGIATGVLSAGAGSSVELTSFRVGGAEVCGLQIADGASMDATDGEVRDNAIGANVQVPDFDVARIQDGVRYFDNGVNLDASSLPLPDLPGGL